MYDVYVAQLNGLVYAVRSNGRVITKVKIGSDCARLLKAAVDAVPRGGSLGIRRGTYGSAYRRLRWSDLEYHQPYK